VESRDRAGRAVRAGCDVQRVGTPVIAGFETEAVAIRTSERMHDAAMFPGAKN
jgi:hypothetical protein